MQPKLLAQEVIYYIPPVLRALVLKMDPTPLQCSPEEQATQTELHSREFVYNQLHPVL